MALKKSDVNYVYQNYLGRDPDEGAIEDLVGQEISRAQLAETILNSDEYKSMTPRGSDYPAVSERLRPWPK
jgi:hypothetical protein